MSDEGDNEISDAKVLAEEFFSKKLSNVKGDALNTNVVVVLLLKLNNLLLYNDENAKNLKNSIQRFFQNKHIVYSEQNNIPFISCLIDKLKEELEKQFKICKGAQSKYR